MNNAAIYCSPTEGSQLRFSLSLFFWVVFTDERGCATLPHAGFHFFSESHLKPRRFQTENFFWITGLCLTFRVSYSTLLRQNLLLNSYKHFIFPYFYAFFSISTYLQTGICHFCKETIHLNHFRAPRIWIEPPTMVQCVKSLRYFFFMFYTKP